MSCVVKGCKNRSDRKKNNPGITFHRFSRENEVWKNDWIQIIRNCNGENDWIPNKYSVVCSIHFEANDLYTTKGGLRRVVTYAVPQKFLIESAHMAEEQPIKQEIASVFVPALGKPCSSTMVLRTDEQSAEPNISDNLQKSISVIGTKVEPPDALALDLRDKQSAKPNISINIQEKSSETKEAQVLTIPYSRRKQCLEQSLIKKQDTIRKQKRKIKTLKQKVQRLQFRNKYLKEILKSLKKNKS
ncbi:unnamed protein product [Arctia plantaginis]|uniref:THAP-type domain-containing protein n=1 Tax=Arctia plantaginis TaxID=874455 RepID=A0A8S0ZJ44_ARCPL|nr:unnamed protein product [Arctia plantaginis]